MSERSKRYLRYAVGTLLCVMVVAVMGSVIYTDHHKVSLRRLNKRHEQYKSPVVSEWEPNEVFVVAAERKGMAPTPFTLIPVVRLSNYDEVWACTETPERFAKGDTVRLAEIRYYRSTEWWEEDSFLYIKSR